MTQGEQGAVNEPGEYFRLGNRSQPRQRRFAFFEEPRYAVAVAGIMVLGIVLRIAATWPMSMHHPDEVIQYLEQAERKSVVSGKSVAVRVDQGGRRNHKQK